MKRKITAKEQYTTYANHPLVAGDVRAYEICLDLGTDVVGAEFKVTAIRADGKVIEDIGQVKDGVATYTLAGNMYSVPGELVVRLAILHNSSVLTDREIVFEVLKGATGTDSGQTTVTINDSVVLRLGAIEQRLLEKVDKIDGKGLSANDFTNEYKSKLDSLDETIEQEKEKILEEVDNLSDSLDTHKDNKENPHVVTASQVGAYSKEEEDTLHQSISDSLDEHQNADKPHPYVYNIDEIDAQMDKRATKTELGELEGRVDTKLGELGDEVADTLRDFRDIVRDNLEEFETRTTKQLSEQKQSLESALSNISTVYKFRGSVSEATKLPSKFEVIPNGKAVAYMTDDGDVEIGSFEDGVLRIDNVTLKQPGGLEIPIVPIDIPDGIYWSTTLFPTPNDSYYMEVGGVHSANTVRDGRVERKTARRIESVLVDLNFYGNIGNITLDGIEVSSFGHLFEVGGLGYTPEGDRKIRAFTLNEGDVYNALDTGMNYAYTGDSWDALGGEHKDLEARESIDALETQVGNIGEALDNIINIQEELIGGGSE